MTECEKIIERGTLSSDFFNEETRCDFFINKDRKKIWAISLDLLMKFDQVCKKHGIKYFLLHGSLLGAVRHKGFIPWDDDVDVGILREEYKKLQEVANEEFADQYFFQTPYTDKGAYYSFAKLRNSNTCGVSKAYRYEKFNQGISLDIYPFDNCNMNEIEQNYNVIKQLALDNSSFMRRANPNLNEKDQERVNKIVGLDPMKTYERIQSIAMQYNGHRTENVSCAVYTFLHWSKQTFPRKLLEDLTELEFEGMRFPVPRNYDEVLKIIYGDYMQFPKIEERGSYHGYAIYDADHSYIDYIL